MSQSSQQRHNCRELVVVILACYGVTVTWLLCLTSRWIAINNSSPVAHDAKDHVALFASEVFFLLYDLWFPHLLTAGLIGLLIWSAKRRKKVQRIP
jgi:hypothetical protein